MQTKNKLLYHATVLVTILIAFITFTNASQTFHNNTSWNRVLFSVVAIVFVVDIIFNARKLMLCIALGYLVGFVFGTIFHQSPVYVYVPAGETEILVRASSWSWASLWALALVFMLILGIILEVWHRTWASYCKKNKQ